MGRTRMALYRLVRPLAFALDAERAHRLTIATLAHSPRRAAPSFPAALRSRVAGIDFPSPVGLAAGFDKNAEAAGAMLAFGFGFVEVGTLTPRPQAGNPKPRLFRLREDRAIINRLGFNNAGQAAATARLRDRRSGIVGVNIGANKDSTDRIADYVEGVAAMAPLADYLTVNISSPNTPGLRGLQKGEALGELLSAIQAARPSGGPPVFLKVAPDLEKGDPDRIVRAALDHGIDGLIVGNTTVSRPPLRSALARQSGGLSGAPLKMLALEALRRFRAASGGSLPLIGVGGIGSAYDAWERIRAGANLVQLYTAMVYHGPGLARTIAAGLETRIKRAGFSSIAEAVGSGR
jgi:dihydroorotate dehydrogenase